HDVKVPVAIVVAAVVLVSGQSARVLIAAGGLLAAEGFEKAVGRGQADARALGLHAARQFLGREALHGVFGQKARHLPLLPGLILAAHQYSPFLSASTLRSIRER